MNEQFIEEWETYKLVEYLDFMNPTQIKILLISYTNLECNCEWLGSMGEIIMLIHKK